MRAKKYMAWIITAAMLVTSIPFSEKRVKADVLPEGTQMKFVVKDLDGTIIKNSEDPDEEKILKFKIGDEETEAVFNNDEYTIDIGNRESAGLEVSIIMGDVIKTESYSADKTEYDVTMSMATPIDITGSVYDEATSTYTVHVPYDPEGKYELPEGVVMDTTDIESNETEDGIYNYAGYEEGVINYRTPGYVKARLTAVRDDGYRIYTPVYLLIDIDNTPEFRADNNKFYDNNVIIEKGGDLVAGVTLKNKKSWNGLNLSCNYDNSIIYESSDAEVSVDGTGRVAINKDSGYDLVEAVITARDRYTGEKASYSLTAYPETSNDIILSVNKESLPYDNKVSINAADYRTDTIPVNIENQDDYTDIVYSSDNENIAAIDTDGSIHILEVGTAHISVTAAKKDEWKKYEKTFTIESKAVDSYIKVYVDGIEKDITETIEISEDDIQNEVVILPISLKMYNENGKETHKPHYYVKTDLQDDNVTVSGSDIIISKTDEIERNVNHTIEIEGSDWGLNKSKVTLSFIINGKEIDNSSIYSVRYIENGTEKPLVSGKVINGIRTRWALTNEVKVGVLDSENYKVSNDNHAEKRADISFLTSNFEEHNKDHAFYLWEKNEESNYDAFFTHEYFGTDLEAPKLTLVNHENINITGKGLYTSGNASINVMAADKDGHLYAVELVDSLTGDVIKSVGMKELAKNDASLKETNVRFDIPFENNTAVHYAVVVWDQAGRKTVRSLAGLLRNAEYGEDTNVLISDNTPASDRLSVENGPDVNKYVTETGNIYVSGESEIVIVSEDAGDVYSGISMITVTVNGEEKTFNADGTGSFTAADNTAKAVLDTADFMTGVIDDKRSRHLAVTVSSEDFAGNVSTPKRYDIYVDRKAPQAEGMTITFGNTGRNKETMTSYGTFYNGRFTMTSDISDGLSGLKSAVLKVGNRTIQGYVTGNGISFDVGDNVSGNAELVLEDSVGNKKNVPYTVIGAGRGVKNSYIDVDTLPVDIMVAADSKPGKYGWYNGKVTFTVKAADRSLSEKSGIRNVTITVNGVRYNAEAYDNRTTSDKEYKVTVDDRLIMETMNEEGMYTVRAEAVDNAGNTSVKEASVYIDTVAPVIGEITGVEPGSDNAGNVTINIPVTEKHFSAEGNGTVITVRKELDGKTTENVITADRSDRMETVGRYTFTEDGTYSVSAVSTDAAGNKSDERKISFIIDNTNPVVRISGVTDGSYVKDSATLEFSAVEVNYRNNDVKISGTRSLNGITEVLDMGGFVSSTKESVMKKVFTDEGEYEITIMAEDGAGNSSKTERIHFTVDTANPEITLAGLDRASYTDTVSGKINIKDNYYRTGTVKLVRSSVTYDETSDRLNITDKEDVTDLFVKTGKESSSRERDLVIEIPKERGNDGLYVLSVTAEDMAGKTSESITEFTVNGYGSVFTFNESLLNLLNNPYVKNVQEDFTVSEYNAGGIDHDKVSVQITRDGAMMQNPEYSVNDLSEKNGWHKYEYVISRDNFSSDGIYRIVISTVDSDGNKSETLKEDRLAAVFYVDTTKPELVSVTGLGKKNYNASEIDVKYELFDAMGIAKVEVYIDGVRTKEITDVEEITQYLGSFSVSQGMNRHIRLVITDKAGNVTDTDVAEDGKYVADFNKNVTISTNIFIRWYANKALFVCSIVCVVLLTAGIVVLVTRNRKKKGTQEK
jgi:hypothetical protein